MNPKEVISFIETSEKIYEMVDNLFRKIDILSAWITKKGNIELPEFFTYGISYASAPSMHPE